MGYKVKESKILFLDSRAGFQLNNKARINFPTESFSSDGSQVIRLTLLEFNLKRTFYNINSTNNVFYVAADSNEIVLTEGNYTSSELATEIASKINDKFGISNVTCTLEAKTDRFIIGVSGASNLQDVKFYSYKIINGKDYDTHHILGGLPTVETGVSNIQNLFNYDSVNKEYKSKYPIQTQTINNIYLKTNLQTNNFETNLNQESDKTSRVVNSQLFASIPVSNSTTDRTINFVDSNNTFQMYLQTKHIDNITFDIETEFGKIIPAIDTDQYSSGNLHYNMVIKYETLDPEIPPSILGEFRGNYDSVIRR